MKECDFKVLIADDEHELVELVASELSEYKVFSAYNGQEALDLIRSEKPDLVISDINMPKILGLECLEKTKQLGFDIPFVFITAFNDGEFLKKAWDLGAFDFLDKPIDLKQLHNVVKMAYLYTTKPPGKIPSENKPYILSEDSTTLVLELDKVLFKKLTDYSVKQGLSVVKCIESMIEERVKS